jgi:L-threonylcarbamoyladenylate synthase
MRITPRDTKIFKVGKKRPPRSVINETVKALHAGGLAVFPTDTVYGLAASIFRPHAIQMIYRLKGRSYKKPLPLLVATFKQAEALVEPISSGLRRLLDDYWPGPLTVVLGVSDLGRWATGGRSTVAVRIPNHPVPLALLRKFNGPLATTSANLSHRPPTVTGQAAAKIFKGKVEVLIDGGSCPKGEASTVLDASSSAWTVVREGAVKKKDLLPYWEGKR